MLAVRCFRLFRQCSVDVSTAGVRSAFGRVSSGGTFPESLPETSQSITDNCAACGRQRLSTRQSLSSGPFGLLIDILAVVADTAARFDDLSRNSRYAEETENADQEEDDVVPVSRIGHIVHVL